MGIFEKYKSGQPDGNTEKLISEIKRVHQKEGLPVDAALVKSMKEIPTTKIYSCKNKCPRLIHLGESIPSECAICGADLELVDTVTHKAMLESGVMNEILARGHYRSGVECIESRDLDSALAAFSRAIELKPDFIDAYHNRSAVRGMQDDPQGAIEDCCHVLRINPEDSGGYFNRGTAKANLGDLEGAVADITEALSHGYDKPIAYLRRGVLLFQLGRGQGARLDLERFVESDPTSEYSDHARKILSLIN